MQCVMCLSHTIYHQTLSVTTTTIFRVPYRNTRKTNNLSKCISEPLKKCSALFIVTEYQLCCYYNQIKFNYLKTHKNWVYCFKWLVYTLYILQMCVSNFLYSQRISTYLLLKLDKVQLLKNT